ncbi:transglycosylase domain-containing protein [Paenibacillus mendelii]|uniref:PBP1A family penicillin-binding protein n=1 Tax=Paenibacillus mendelii TaxID=206163 RepID=A0ABV6J8I1_9BACL|nr:PBP1A family penicillin-binding protein [Paenibacillus mendelii]MCQ6560184.1 PBP1A family penicillin-binding protein [Paenibacillus mendelii]
MADGPRTTKKKPAGKGKKKKMNGKKFMVWLFFTAAFAVVCGIIGYLLIILNGERILTENQDKFVMEEASTIYDADGKEVTKLARINREIVEFNEIPVLMRDAFIATEDRRFEEHSGIDLWSIGRALVKDIIARSAVEGGSTITQQLAKNLFLSHDKTFFRKATEASIAVALENKYTKDEIITMYLNRIYFGKGAYGVKAAANYYFDRPLDKLELWQIATLAGTPKSPNKYNPISNPEKSKERMAVVLLLMKDQGYITQEEMDQAKAAAEKYEPPANKTTTVEEQKYLAFVDFVVDEAEQRTGLTEEQLRLGGYKIYTTLNRQAQSVMEKEFEDNDNFEKSVDEQKVQGAMIIVDHRNGNIQGLVGGRDYVNKGLNRVLVPRQPGSSFKPITAYGPALDTGDWFPWSNVMDEKRCYGNYCPSDSNRVKYIGSIPMTQSIKESRNASAVWLLNEIGVKTGLNFAEKLGFELDEKNDRNLAIALGGLTTGVTPLQMAKAYSAFANNGVEVDPHALLKVVGKNEETVYEYSAPSPNKLMEPKIAGYMTELLQTVLEKGGTGTGARIDRPVAGKTGTTQHGIPNYKSSYNRDAWFAGYTPEWTGIVWMGYDKTDKEHLLKKSSSQSAKLFAKVMKASMKGMPVTNFTKQKDAEEDKKTVGKVTGLNAVYNTETKMVNLTWAPVEGEGITYRVYRKEASEPEATRLMDALDAAGTDDMSVQPGMTYQYYVTAYDPNNEVESAPSDKLSVEIPAEELTLPELPSEPGEETPPPDGGEPPIEGGDPGTNQPGNGSGNPNNGGSTPPDGGNQNGGNGNSNGNGNGSGNGSGNGAGGDGATTGPIDNGNGSNEGTPPANNSGTGGNLEVQNVPGQETLPKSVDNSTSAEGEFVN